MLALAGLVAAGTWTRADAANLAPFGRCLGQSGAVFYGASWCPHCRSQRMALGDAMDHVRYVECSDPSDPDRPAAACRSANVNSYPTWIFRDGSRLSGELSLMTLAAKTGCTLPSGAGSPPAAPRGGGAEPAARPISHGAKVIEVPD
jgi:hypothetical protein